MAGITGNGSLANVELANGQANLTDATSTEVIGATADRYTYITDIVITAKAGATSIHTIDILEGSTVLITIYVSLGTLVNSQSISLATPIKTSATNVAINAQSSASPTGFDAYVTVSGFKAGN